MKTVCPCEVVVISSGLLRKPGASIGRRKPRVFNSYLLELTCGCVDIDVSRSHLKTAWTLEWIGLLTRVLQTRMSITTTKPVGDVVTGAVTTRAKHSHFHKLYFLKIISNSTGCICIRMFEFTVLIRNES